MITALALATVHVPALSALAALTAVCLGFLAIEVRRRGPLARF
ncbi:hypothetical protein [Micromonospora sp. AP08]|nr:hypothetical protein [Micromonospora sp. AP08]